MSENLDLVRSIYADWERGEFDQGAWADPEFEFVSVDGPSPGTFRGTSAMADWMRETMSAWEDFRSEAEEFRELDGERVLVLSRRLGRGKASGFDFAQLQSRTAAVLYVRGAQVVRVVLYWDRDNALADLDLEA